MSYQYSFAADKDLIADKSKTGNYMDDMKEEVRLAVQLKLNEKLKVVEDLYTLPRLVNEYEDCEARAARDLSILVTSQVGKMRQGMQLMDTFGRKMASLRERERVLVTLGRQCGVERFEIIKRLNRCRTKLTDTVSYLELILDIDHRVAKCRSLLEQSMTKGDSNHVLRIGSADEESVQCADIDADDATADASSSDHGLLETHSKIRRLTIPMDVLFSQVSRPDEQQLLDKYFAPVKKLAEEFDQAIWNVLSDVLSVSKSNPRLLVKVFQVMTREEKLDLYERREIGAEKYYGILTVMKLREFTKDRFRQTVAFKPVSPNSLEETLKSADELMRDIMVCMDYLRGCFPTSASGYEWFMESVCDRLKSLPDDWLPLNARSTEYKFATPSFGSLVAAEKSGMFGSSGYRAAVKKISAAALKSLEQRLTDAGFDISDLQDMIQDFSSIFFPRSEKKAPPPGVLAMFVKMYHKHMAELIQRVVDKVDELNPIAVVKVLSWVEEYHWKLEEVVDFPVDTMRMVSDVILQPNLNTLAVAITKKYLGSIGSMMKTWVERLVVIERSNPPITDSDGKYFTNGPQDLFKLIDEQVTLILNASNGRLFLQICGVCRDVLLHYARATTKMMDDLIAAELDQKDKDDGKEVKLRKSMSFFKGKSSQESNKLLVVVGIANNVATLLNLTDSFRDMVLDNAEPSVLAVMANDLATESGSVEVPLGAPTFSVDGVIDALTDISVRCITYLTQRVIKDIIVPCTPKVCSRVWYDNKESADDAFPSEEDTINALATLVEELGSKLNDMYYKKVMGACLDRLIVEYLRQWLIVGRKQKGGASLKPDKAKTDKGNKEKLSKEKEKDKDKKSKEKEKEKVEEEDGMVWKGTPLIQRDRDIIKAYFCETFKKGMLEERLAVITLVLQLVNCPMPNDADVKKADREAAANQLKARVKALTEQFPDFTALELEWLLRRIEGDRLTGLSSELEQLCCDLDLSICDWRFPRFKDKDFCPFRLLRSTTDSLGGVVDKGYLEAIDQWGPGQHKYKSLYSPDEEQGAPGQSDSAPNTTVVVVGDAANVVADDLVSGMDSLVFDLEEWLDDNDGNI